MSIVLPQLIPRLRRHRKPINDYGVVEKKAAVAISLASINGDVCLLMIRRAERAGDPWSGHMGFPGGRRDNADTTNLACAKRETHEELGVDLNQCAELVCELGEVNTGWRPDRPELLVTPFVFELKTVPAMTPNHEVDGVVWVPMHFLLDRSNRIPLKWQWQNRDIESDSYEFEGHRIWGLSLMMLDELMQAAER